ncbi:MAG: 8-oxo-dGTP diphosphatase MutT [Verrucomicrobia bacterium]|nr:MAG: 8-oxo-dGTP diphosphatase MutT [Verrucomicrobiota bacterium]
MHKIDDPSLQHSNTPRPQPIDVAAGLVFRGGRLLLTQRPCGTHLGGLWEFPGGKRHAGETFEDCLRRELKEELGIEVTVGELLESVTHDYAEKIVHLKFFRCRLLQNEPQALGCRAFAWVNRTELASYNLPPADARLLEKLQRASELWSDLPNEI